MGRLAAGALSQHGSLTGHSGLFCAVCASKLLHADLCKVVGSLSKARQAGLWSAVCLSKGCYMGQETLAKVFNLRAHRRRLAGLALSGPAAVGTPVMLGTPMRHWPTAP